VSRPPVVVDTNVVVAGLLTADPSAPTAQILDAMLAGRLRFLLSVELLSEYRRVLLRPKIAARHGLLPEEVDEILVALAENGVVTATEESTRAPVGQAAAPPGDAHLGHLLAAAPAARLVTGDAAAARAFAPRAVTPRGLLTELDR
jgi:uncharacterized protein